MSRVRCSPAGGLFPPQWIKEITLRAIGLLLMFGLAAASQVARADSIWEDIDMPDAADIGGDATGQTAWGGKVNLGYLATSGNTETTSLNTKGVVGLRSGDWQHVLMVEAIRATESGQTTAKRTQAAEKSEYSFSEHNYVFGLLNYEKDEFSGFDRRTSEAVGYGRRILHDDSQTLDLEAGVGARQTEFTDGSSRRASILRTAGDYSLKLSDTGSFSEELAVEAGRDNTYTESVTSLTSSLTGTLALQVSYTVKHNSTVLAGRENTDTFTSVSLQYSF
jgi:putative salt-induced outer membrane protein